MSLINHLTAATTPTGEITQGLVPLGEHELLVLWVQIAALVITARFLGWIMKRIGLPGVIGELLAGVVLGPSIFGQIWPGGFDWFLPGGDAVQSGALLAISWLGVAFLLVVTGFETDLNLISKLGRPAAYVTASSLFFPMVGGFATGFILPDSFLPDSSSRITFTLFVMAALSVSSLAVVAKILGDLGLMRRDFAQITVAAGMGNDVIGWIMLGIFSGIAASGSFDISSTLLTIGALLALLVFALTLGQRWSDIWLRRMRKSNDSLGGSMSVLLVVMLLFAVATQYLKVEAILGAFLAGVMLNRSRYLHEHTLERLESLTVAFFAPLFFATAGLRIDLSALSEGNAWVWAIAIVIVAVVTKFFGSYWGSRLAGRTKRGSFALGAGLNARGALEIVIATVGLALGVFNDVSYTAIVLVPIITSLLASLGLRSVVRNWRGDPSEIMRLEREEALSKNLIVTTSRLLVPSRGGRGSVAVSQVLHFAWPPEAGATILTVNPVPGSRATKFLRAGLSRRPTARTAVIDPANRDLDKVNIDPLKGVFHERNVDHQQVKRADIVDAIVSEAQLGYGAIGISLRHPQDSEVVLTPMVEELLSVSPLPVIMVRLPETDGLPPAFSNALVPVSSAPTTRVACEVAFNISSQLGTQISLAHFTAPDAARSTRHGFFSLRRQHQTDDRSQQRGQEILATTSALASELNVAARTTLEEAPSTAEGILELQSRNEHDLIVMGCQLRRVNNAPHLGPTAESVLRSASATVVLVLMPFDL